MKELVQVIFIAIVAVILFSIIGLLIGGGDSGGLCDDSSNQYVDDQSWYELCKDE